MLAPVATPRSWFGEDVRMVQRAATMLGIPEFAFFHLAHRRWFGHAAADAEIEPHFMHYLYTRRAPSWVRHLAREVVERGERGEVLPEDYGVRPTLPRPIPEGPLARHRPALMIAIYGACFLLITWYAL